MNDFNPLVSIIIPVYNGSNYLIEAIDSALAQTYRNIEILVVNDGSKDDGATRNIAISYGSQIRYFEKENGGVATALNLGIEKMQGEYFSWLSHDDKYLPEKIEKQINFLSFSANKNSVIYSDLEYIDENSKFLSQLRFPDYPPENFRPAFIKGGLINGCTLLVPKDCFEYCGVFDSSLRTTQDYDLWFRISERFDFIHISDILIQSRLHGNQDSIKLLDTSFQERDILHSQFIKSLSQEEVYRFSKGNTAGYYIKFAYMMEFSMLWKAERCAINKALSNFQKSTLLQIARNIIKISLLIVIITMRKILIFLFGIETFAKIRKKALSFRQLKL